MSDRDPNNNGGVSGFKCASSGCTDYALVGSYYCDGHQPIAKRHRMARPAEPLESREAGR